MRFSAICLANFVRLSDCQIVRLFGQFRLSFAPVFDRQTFILQQSSAASCPRLVLCCKRSVLQTSALQNTIAEEELALQT